MSPKPIPVAVLIGASHVTGEFCSQQAAALKLLLVVRLDDEIPMKVTEVTFIRVPSVFKRSV